MRTIYHYDNCKKWSNNYKNCAPKIAPPFYDGLMTWWLVHSQRLKQNFIRALTLVEV